MTADISIVVEQNLIDKAVPRYFDKCWIPNILSNTI